MSNGFVLKGDICYSQDPKTISTIKNGYVICEDGICQGVFTSLPARFASFPVTDFSHKIIIPGLCDLHMHAPQYSFRALGMDLELLDWLKTRTFPEEARYADKAYAEKAYTALISALKASATTRLCMYATVHTETTILLMSLLEHSGLVSMVGKVNMDRNCCSSVCESSPKCSADATEQWLTEINGWFTNTTPILTPRFIPSCSDDLMRRLAVLRKRYNLPIQSHLSESRGEITWVAELCPNSTGYARAYDDLGMLGGDTPAVMAHCVWSDEKEIQLLHDRGIYIAHCPQSNINLSSGIAPVRRFVNAGIRTGLGSDMAGGHDLSIFRAMADAIQVSKLHWCLVDQNDAPLTLEEVFWMGTAGGGEFFGNVGRFEKEYEFDAVVIDDSSLAAPFAMTLPERLARIVYLSDDRHIVTKFVRGQEIRHDAR